MFLRCAAAFTTATKASSDCDTKKSTTKGDGTDYTGIDLDSIKLRQKGTDHNYKPSHNSQAAMGEDGVKEVRFLYNNYLHTFDCLFHTPNAIYSNVLLVFVYKYSHTVELHSKYNFKTKKINFNPVII